MGTQSASIFPKGWCLALPCLYPLHQWGVMQSHPSPSPLLFPGAGSPATKAAFPCVLCVAFSYISRGEGGPDDFSLGCLARWSVVWTQKAVGLGSLKVAHDRLSCVQLEASSLFWSKQTELFGKACHKRRRCWSQSIPWSLATAGTSGDIFLIALLRGWRQKGRLVTGVKARKRASLTSVSMEFAPDFVGSLLLLRNP